MAIAELNPGAPDEAVLELAYSEVRILLTEDKDFGVLAHAGGQQATGIMLIRFPANARSTLCSTVVRVVDEFGERLKAAFAVVEPGRIRISEPPELG
jgi:predicted nuclease of predicted toxin-antitoxin system